MKSTFFISILLLIAALMPGCRKTAMTKGNLANMNGVHAWTGVFHREISSDTSYNVSFKILISVIDDTTIVTHLYDTAGAAVYSSVTLHFCASDSATHTITYATGTPPGTTDAFWADTLVYNYADYSMTQHQINSGMAGFSELQIRTQ